MFQIIKGITLELYNTLQPWSNLTMVM